MSKYIVESTDLTAIANEIRTKGDTSAQLSFPSGFVDAISQMDSGAKYVSGSFTVPNDGIGYYTISLGKTLSKYIFYIEATSASKTEILNSGLNANKAYMFLGCYPKTEVNNVENAYTACYQRVNPSSGAVDMATNSGAVLTDTSIRLPVGAFATGAFYLYNNCTYNYFVCEIK